MKTVTIGMLEPGDLFFTKDGKICKLIAHVYELIPGRPETKFENEAGNVDWVWSNYRVLVD